MLSQVFKIFKKVWSFIPQFIFDFWLHNLKTKIKPRTYKKLQKMKKKIDAEAVFQNDYSLVLISDVHSHPIQFLYFQQYQLKEFSSQKVVEILLRPKNPRNKMR